MFKKPLFWEMFLMIAVAVILNYFAKIYHLYWSIYEFDSLVHFIAGIGVALFFLWFYFSSGFFNPLKRNFAKFLMIAIIGTVFVAILWEIYELMMGETMVQKVGYPYDTTMDIIMTVSGALVGCFYAFLGEENIKKEEKITDVITKTKPKIEVPLLIEGSSEIPKNEQS
jgi:hypothetical protein